MDHVCIHVPHLDLVNFGQNVSTTAGLMLRLHKPYILKNVPHFCPGNFFFHFDITYPSIIGLTTHINFNFPTHQRDMEQPIKKKFTSSLFKRKPLIAQILKRWLLVAKQVPYKFPKNIASKLLTLHAVN